MADNNEIVLDIKINTEQVATKLAAATKSLAEHKQQQKELKKAMEESNGTNAVAAKMYAEVSAQIEKENREIKSSTALLQAEAIARIDDNSSLDEQRQLLNAAQKAYAQLSGEEKAAADAAGGLRDQINALSDRVKNQEMGIGDARRNVGFYTDSIVEAANKLGGFGSGITGVISPLKGMTAGLKAASATPFIAIISVAITILQKLAERFKGNAAAMERLTGIMGAFSGAANIVNIIIDKIAEGLGWIAEKALELANKLGILNDSMKEGQAIAQEDLAIQKEQQRVALANAESQNKIAKLKADAAEKDKYTAKERLNFMQQAADEEEAIAQRQYDLAKREYDLQVRKNAQSASSMDDLKKENDLKIAMINAETDLFNKRKELNGQMAELRAQVAKGNDISVQSTKDTADEINNIRKEMVRWQRSALENEIADLEEKRDKELAIAGLTEEEKLAITEHYNQEMERLREEDAKNAEEAEVAKIEARMAAREKFGLEPEKSQEEQELYDLEQARAQDLINQEEYEQAKNAIVEKYAAERQKTIDDEIRKNTIEMAQAYSKGLSAIGSVFEQLQNAFEVLGNETEDSKKAAKAFAWVSLLTSQAQAIANTVAAITQAIANAQQSAAATGPAAVFTAPAFIAEMVGITAGATATAISGIVQAKQLISQAQGYETGGIVPGTSYTGDRVPAMLNSGEMILNRKSQARLFDALSGNGDQTLGFDYELMAAANAALPAPVVVYSELQEFGQKTATYNEIAQI